MRFIWILTLLPAAAFAFEPISITTGVYAAGAAIASYFYYSYDPCQKEECCKEPWMRSYVSTSYDNKLYGQPLVIEVLKNTVRKRSQYGKSMALSFHGPVGTGKTYLSTLISESLFTRGKSSKYVHFFTVGYDFPNPNNVGRYQVELRNKIYLGLLQCPSSVFIFDEFDKMPSGLHETIAPFLEPRGYVDGVPTGNAIFIFLSNTGSKAIVRKSYELWNNGVERKDFKLSDFERDLQNAVYNEEGSYKESALIRRELIDAYVPFLPLEKSHVISCIKTEYRRFHSYNNPPSNFVDEILEKIQFSSEGLYAETGCKKVSALVARY